MHLTGWAWRWIAVARPGMTASDDSSGPFPQHSPTYGELAGTLGVTALGTTTFSAYICVMFSPGSLEHQSLNQEPHAVWY